MDRRDFIKNSLLLGTYSCLAYGIKSFYDLNSKKLAGSGIKLEKKHLIEKYYDKRELPRKIRLEACSLCQLNCPACIIRLHSEQIKNGCGSGYLSFKNFRKLVDANYFEEIELSNSGEIFLNPELLDIIKYAHEKNVALTALAGVNLNYLTDEMAEALVKYKFRYIVVSIDGATSETYAIYRRGGDFNTVIGNIKKINYFKKKYNSIYPILTYKFILFGHNEHEIDKAKKLAKELDMYIKFQQNYLTSYSPLKTPEVVKEKTGIDINVSSEQSAIKNYAKDQWFACEELWTKPQINWDGKVLGCCCNYYSDFGGNVFEDGLLTALNHPKLIYAKNMLTNNAKIIQGLPCSNCSKLSIVRQTNLFPKSLKESSSKIL